MATEKICSINGCGKRVAARSLCWAHYAQQRRNGDPLHFDRKRDAMAAFIQSLFTAPTDECVPWPFSRPDGKYGTYLSEAAHRYTCRLVNGEPPDDKPLATHTCGNGHMGCVNPRHLRWGSTSDNVKDTLRHGTSPFAKLTANQVSEIVAKYPEPEHTAASLAAEYGVKKRTIYDIVQGRTWKDFGHKAIHKKTGPRPTKIPVIVPSG